MVKDDLILSIAKIIHQYGEGLHFDDSIESLFDKLSWEQLDEWQRDEYKIQSRKIFEFLKYNGLLRGV